jgi:hypothetical protein
MVWHFSYTDGYSTVYFFWMLGWETRKKLSQEHRKRVSETKNIVRLLSYSLASLKAANQEVLVIRN